MAIMERFEAWVKARLVANALDWAGDERAERQQRIYTDYAIGLLKDDASGTPATAAPAV
ncbi:MAG: hypothetical protein UHD09_05710 [Bifidobacterium sp.]|nr:hypothetical protein [Bifidobacterium sp.]